jgi:hypothetical protein
MTKLFVCYHAVTALTEHFYQNAFALRGDGGRVQGLPNCKSTSARRPQKCGDLRVTGQIALNRSSKGFDMRFKTEKLKWSEWSGLIRRMLVAVSVSYRPELHYMRGPGPKWREKHARPPR